MYAVLSVALGNQNTLNQPIPFWNPLDWNVGYLLDTLRNFWHDGPFLQVFLRTVGLRLRSRWRSRSLIGYPVAYYAARHAGRWRGLVLLLLVLPFWINYLMRMLAWINLLSPGGWGTRFLHDFGIEGLFEKLGLLSQDGGWLNGQASSVVIALVYGYIPYLILPLYAALDRIDQRHIEAARDLGASPFAAFRRVTLPLSMPGHPRGHRADRPADVRRLLHPGPDLGLAAHEHDRQPDRRVRAPGLAEDRRRRAHDAARARPARADVLLPAHHPRADLERAR